MNQINLPLTSHLLNTRTRKALAKKKIKEVDDLCNCSYKDFIVFPNFGVECLRNLVEFLEIQGKNLYDMPSLECLNEILTFKRRYVRHKNRYQRKKVHEKEKDSKASKRRYQRI